MTLLCQAEVCHRKFLFERYKRVFITRFEIFISHNKTAKGQVKKYDQTMPLLTTQLFKDSPGLVGMYISAAYRKVSNFENDILNF